MKWGFIEIDIFEVGLADRGDLFLIQRSFKALLTRSSYASSISAERP